MSHDDWIDRNNKTEKKRTAASQDATCQSGCTQRLLLIPSIVEAWLRASEKIAILSSGAGFLPAEAKRELMLPGQSSRSCLPKTHYSFGWYGLFIIHAGKHCLC